MNRRFEPEVVEAAREALRRNSGYVAHGPDVCPRDIIEAFDLGVAWGQTAAARRPDGSDAAEAIRNPLRTLKRETAHRLAELASDLECGLKVQETLVADWTTPEERAELDAGALLKLAGQRLADDLREALAAAEPRDQAAADEVAEQMSVAAARSAALATRAAA
jgi:hypothetical protein